MYIYKLVNNKYKIMIVLKNVMYFQFISVIMTIIKLCYFKCVIYKCIYIIFIYFLLLFSNLADAFIQSDLQMRTL